jgi:heme-degrading monooxygenase HmoA
MSVFAVGVWTLKEGHQDDFERAWESLAQWSVEEGLVAHATLVRDRADGRRYVSFAPGASAEHVERWRSSSGFQAYLGQIMASVESFEPGTFDTVLSVS